MSCNKCLQYMVDGVSGDSMETALLPVETELRQDTEVVPTQPKLMVEMTAADITTRVSAVTLVIVQVRKNT